MRKIIVLSLVLLAGCTSVPRDAVDLSKMMNDRVEAEHTAYINLFNQYFALKRQRIDDWILTVYIPTRMDNIRKEMKEKGVKDIDDEALKKIIKDIQSQRDSMQEDLEKTRQSILEKVTLDHNTLANAGGQMTAFLQSMVDVREASQNFAQTATAATGGRFDFAEFDAKFDQALQKAGDVSTKGLSLFEEVKPLIGGVN